MNKLQIDCGQCVAFGVECGTCIVSALLGPIEKGPLFLSSDEVEALSVLSDSDMLPPLRLVPVSVAAG